MTFFDRVKTGLSMRIQQFAAPMQTAQNVVSAGVLTEKTEMLPTGSFTDRFWDIPNPYRAFNYMFRQGSRTGEGASKRKRLILYQGWSIQANESNPRGEEHADFLEQVALEKIDVEKVLGSLLNAIFYGFQAIDLRYERNDRGEIYVAEWRPLPHVNFTFNETVQNGTQVSYGILGGGQGFGINGGDVRQENPYNLLWFNAEEDPSGDPRGVSAFARAYWYYRFKRHSIQLWEQFGERFAVPALLGKYEHAAKGSDEKTLAQLNATYTEQLKKIRNAAVAAFTGMEITPLEVKASSNDVFEKMLKFANTEIDLSVLGTSMLTDPSGGSYSLADTHSEILMAQSQGDGKALENYLNRTLIKWLIQDRFGDQPDGYPELRFDFKTKAKFEEIMQAVDRGIPISSRFFYDSANIAAPQDEEDALENNKGGDGMEEPEEEPREETEPVEDDLGDDPPTGETMSSRKSFASEADRKKKAIERRWAEIDRWVSSSEEELVRLYQEEAIRWAQEEEPDLSPSEEFIRAAEIPMFQILMGSWLWGALTISRNANQVQGRPAPTLKKDAAPSVKALKDAIGMPEDLYSATSFRAYDYGSRIGRLKAFDLHQRLRETLTKAQEITPGLTKKQWWEGLKAKGLVSDLDLETARKGFWNTTFRTNMQTAYSAAEFEYTLQTQDLWFALEYIALDDERTTELCNSLSGTIEPVQSSFWSSYYPPNHFNCRSGVGRIPKAEAEQDPEIKLVAPPDPLPEHPTASFNSNPATNWDVMKPETRDRARKYGILRDMDDRTARLKSMWEETLRRAEK